MSKTLKENIQSNKAAILYYTGVFLVSALNVAVSNLNDIIPEDVWWGAIIRGVASLGLIYFTIIAKFIFGRDADLDRVKWERQQLGLENTDLKIINEGLRVTNTMQNQVLQEAGITKIEYDKPFKPIVKKKIEKKKDEPEL